MSHPPEDGREQTAADVAIRLADVADAPVLWHMLTYAASMRPGGRANIVEAQTDAGLRSYVEGWMRAGDLGVVAIDAHGDGIGAAWVRLADERATPNKVASVHEPELAIGVIPEARGAGIGARLLSELITRARPLYPAIVLTVREENPSMRLYERAGFVAVRHVVNRVGGRSTMMRLAL